MHENHDDKTTPALRELMSRLADGDLASADGACDAWRGEPGAREAWATYHLIGDVLRSEELATGLGRSEVFLAGFRRRLADEPVLLAPSPPARPQRMRWAGPVAAAAGFAAVAVTMVVLRTAGPAAPDDDRTLARGPGASPAAVSVAGATVAGAPQWQAAHRALIRDQQLDAYLRAHRGAPEATPGAASGRFETVVLDR